MIRRNKGIIFVCVVAIIVRIILLLYAIGFREHPDILRWKDWGRIAFLYGFADTYTPTHLSFGTYPNNMPPGTLYVVSAMYWAWLQIGKVLAVFGIPPGSNSWVNVVLLRICVTIPSLVADIGIGWLVHDFVKRWGSKGKRSLLAASAYLFNPAVLYNSAVWGQMDSVNNVFFIFGMWLLLRKNVIGSAAAFAVSILVKFSLIFAVPYWIVATWFQAKRNTKKLVLPACIGIGVILAAVLPISRNPAVWVMHYLRHNSTGEMTNITAFAYNIWWVIFRPELVFEISRDISRVVDIHLFGSPLTQTLYRSVSLGSIAVTMALLVQIPVYVVFFRRLRTKKILDPKTFVSVFASLAILSYLFLPQMHERYVYPALAPLAILVGFGVPVFYELVVLSFLNFFNLLSVWHPMPLPQWMFVLLRDQNFQWSVALCTSLAGIWTVWNVLRPNVIFGKK